MVFLIELDVEVLMMVLTHRAVCRRSDGAIKNLDLGGIDF